jgi:hypothetical protein
LAALSLVAAACGGSSEDGAEVSAGAKRDSAWAYSVCMRRHGVPKFPDPTEAPDGGPDFGEIGPSTGLNPGSPQFKAAQKACSKLVPGGPLSAPPPKP